jgi:hypothetical protein
MEAFWKGVFSEDPMRVERVNSLMEITQVDEGHQFSKGIDCLDMDRRSHPRLVPLSLLKCDILKNSR